MSSEIRCTFLALGFDRLGFQLLIHSTYDILCYVIAREVLGERGVNS